MKKLIHDDDCGEFLDNAGRCPRCDFVPDMQSIAFVETCPACVDESFIVQQFPTLDISGCNSVKLRTAPIDQLCDDHRKERERIDSGVDKTPIERLVDGYPFRWIT